MAKLETYHAANVEDLFIAAIYKYQNAILNLGIVSKKAAIRILASTGLRLNGYAIILNSDNLWHIYNEHFREADKRQRGITPKDINSIHKVVNEFDSIKKTMSGNIISLKFSKKNPDGILSVILIVSIKKRMMTGKTLYVKSVKLPNPLPKHTSITGLTNYGKDTINQNISQESVLV